MGMNVVILSGTVASAPDSRVTQTGQTVLKFRIACTESWKDKQGQTRDRTEWFNIAVWGRAAEAVQASLAEGVPVLVRGRIGTRTWEDKQGQKRTEIEITADAVDCFGAASQPAPQQAARPAPVPQGRPAGRPAPQSPAEAPGPAISDDDCPF